MASKIPEGYKWVYIKGHRVMIKDKDFDYTRDIETDDWVDNKTGKSFVSDTELIEDRRERDFENMEKEKKRLNDEEKLRDKLKEQKEKKPRRKPIRDDYRLSQSIDIKGKSYIVKAKISTKDKFDGYMVVDEDGTYWRIDRFGDIVKW